MWCEDLALPSGKPIMRMSCQDKGRRKLEPHPRTTIWRVFINTFKNSLSDDRINWPSGIFPNITCYEALVSKSAWPPVWWESHFSLLEFPQVCSQLCDSFQLFIQKTLNRHHHCGKSIGLWLSAPWKCLGGLFFLIWPLRFFFSTPLASQQEEAVLSVKTSPILLG